MGGKVNDLPQPPIPSDADLRDFPFTPIYRTRLFGSGFNAHATDAEWRVGITLWLKSWDQVPAGSLPSSDVDLCRLAELGRDLRTWKEVRDGAMRGWVACSDGRLYHPVVAEGVNEAWTRKLQQRWKTECARLKKHNGRNKDNPLPIPTFEEWRAGREGRNVPEDSEGTSAGTSDNVPEDKDGTSPETNGNVPEDKRECPRGQTGMSQRTNGNVLEDTEGTSPRTKVDVPEDTEGTSPRTKVDVPEETASKRQGQRQGQRKDITAAADARANSGTMITAEMERQLFDAAGNALNTPSGPDLLSMARPMHWLEIGADWELDVLPTIKAHAARGRPHTIRSWFYFDGPIADAMARRKRPMPEGRTDDQSSNRPTGGDSRRRSTYLGIASSGD